MNEKKKVTIYDLAKITGFSVGTVNRALSGKSRINPETKQHILDTAARLGYKANAAAQGLRRSQIKIGVVLYCPVQEYVDAIVKGMNTKALELEKYNVYVDIKQIPYTTNEECRLKALEYMNYYLAEKYNGVVLFLSSVKTDIHDICKVVEEMNEKGIPVATVANDIPESSRIIHVGIDAFAAGRMAAELLWLCCPHRDVALLTNSTDSEVNRNYTNGFFDFAGKNRFSSIKIYEHFDEPELVIKETDRMIEENPDLSGIYMTSASATSACQHIQKVGKKNLKIITTDLLHETPDILKDETACATIFQDPYRQGRDVLKHLYTYLISKEEEGIHFITPSIIFSSNVNAYI